MYVYCILILKSLETHRQVFITLLLVNWQGNWYYYFVSDTKENIKNILFDEKFGLFTEFMDFVLPNRQPYEYIQFVSVCKIMKQPVK